MKTHAGIEYRIESPSGPPLIWAHGLMMNMHFEDQVGWCNWPLIHKSARVIRYDARGHGHSLEALTPEGNRWDQLGGDMLAIASGLGHPSVIAGGQSMGSATALFAALQNPTAIKALILMTPPTAWERRATQASNYRKMAERVAKRGVGVVEQLVAMTPSMPRWMFEAHPEKNQFALDAIHGFTNRSLENVLLGAALSNLPDAEQLAMIKQPTLILAWTDDGGHPLEVAEKLADTLPKSRLHVADGMSKVAGWSEIICDFINSTSSNSQG